MARRHINAALAPVLVALLLVGCGSSSMQSEASSFIAEHQHQAARVRQGALAADAALARLGEPPSAAQLSALAAAAQQGHDLIAHAHDEWVTAEGGAEEILSAAEIEADDGANEMRDALAGLVAYAARPEAGALARYQAQLRVGREKWDEAVRQIWHLGSHSGAPIA